MTKVLFYLQVMQVKHLLDMCGVLVSFSEEECSPRGLSAPCSQK